MILNTIPKTWIYLGKVVRPHGIKGALLIKLENASSPSLRSGVSLHFRSEKGSPRSCEVVSFLAGRLLKLKGIEDRNSAEKLVRAEIFLDRSDFPALDDDEIYLNDMIGFEIRSLEGALLGEVSGFSDNAAQLLVQVKLPDNTMALIPFVKPLVQKIDEENKVILVDLPAGLL